MIIVEGVMDKRAGTRLRLGVLESVIMAGRLTN